jgi:hypothetical protein
LKLIQGKGGLNNNKNKLNGKRPGNGRNYKNSLGGGRGKGKTKNKNGNSKGVGGKILSNASFKFIKQYAHM